MPFYPSPATAARISLTERLDRLRQGLQGLGERLREGLARLVGDAVAGATRDVLRALLGGNGPAPEGHSDQHPLPPYRRGATSWDNAAGRAHTPWPDDWLDGPEVGLADEEVDQEDEPCPHAGPPPRGEGPRQARWGQALAVGCQATAWWLRHRTGRRAVLAGLAVGLASALAVYLGGALALAGASLAASALTLLALSDPPPVRSTRATAL